MGDNVFDDIGELAFDVTTDIMGYDAQWVKSETETLSARVHYRDPSKETEIGDKEYNTSDGVIEFKKNDFPGLIEKLESNNRETIKVKIESEWKEFLAYKPAKFFDGKVYKAMLQLNE